MTRVQTLILRSPEDLRALGTATAGALIALRSAALKWATSKGPIAPNSVIGALYGVLSRNPFRNMNPLIDPLQEPLLGFMWFCSADLGPGGLGLFLLHPIKIITK